MADIRVAKVEMTSGAQTCDVRVTVRREACDQGWGPANVGDLPSDVYDALVEWLQGVG